MATHTTYYNLTKPAQNDKVNIGVLNDNADIIDTALHNKVDSNNLTANNVMMSDGVTSVEDALDELTGNHVVSNMYSPLTKETEFECPSDGYLLISYNANCLVGLRTKDAEGTDFYIMRHNLTASGSSVLPFFVRKGMVIIWLNESTNTAINYRAVVPR